MMSRGKAVQKGQPPLILREYVEHVGQKFRANGGRNAQYDLSLVKSACDVHAAAHVAVLRGVRQEIWIRSALIALDPLERRARFWGPPWSASADDPQRQRRPGPKITFFLISECVSSIAHGSPSVWPYVWSRVVLTHCGLHLPFARTVRLAA
jgi:hypothetical protein